MSQFKATFPPLAATPEAVSFERDRLEVTTFWSHTFICLNTSTRLLLFMRGSILIL